MLHKEYSGRTALVRYRGGVVGEDPFDDCSTGEPERIIIGAGEVPRGIEEALYGMEIGEQRTVIVPCAKAYGEHDPEGVVRYLRSFLADGAELHVGDLVTWLHPVSQRVVPVRIVEETEDTLTVDFNHLLAGKDLEYWLELVDVL